MRETIQPIPMGLVPKGFLVSFGTGRHQAVMLESRWARQPEHLSTAIHLYDLGAPEHCAALALIHPDFANYLGLTRLQCLQILGVVTRQSRPPQDDFEHLVVDHLADCLRLNRMACRYPYMDVVGDDGDCRPGWIYTKYLAHSLEHYAEVLAAEFAIYGVLRIQQQRWRADWLGARSRLWPSALAQDLHDYELRHRTPVFDAEQYASFVAEHCAQPA